MWGQVGHLGGLASERGLAALVYWVGQRSQRNTRVENGVSQVYGDSDLVYLQALCGEDPTKVQWCLLAL